MSDKLELKVVFAAVDKFLRPVKAITAGANEASKALKANRDRIQELNRTLAQVDAFKKAEKDAAIAANAFQATQARVAALRDEIDRVGVPTKAMTKELEKAGKEAERLRQRHESLMGVQQQYFQKLKAGGVDISRLTQEHVRLASAKAQEMNASARLSSALEVENQKMRQLHAARARMEKLNATRDKLAGAGGKMMMAGAAVNAAAAVPVVAYAKAEDSATQLKVALMDKGGQIAAQFSEINALAEKLGNRLPGTTSDFQDMMTMLIRQGMPAKAILGGLGEATAYLAVQLKMAPTAAAEFASKLQDATRTTDKEMMGLMDTIQKTYYLGVDQNNMLQGFAKLSPALSILKQEGLAAANALAPLLVMTDQAGMAGEAAGNAFRKIFQMSLDAKKIAKGNAELAGTGIKLDFSNGKGEFGGLDKMYKQLEQLKGVNTQQRLAALKKIFGDDAETLQALTIMIEKGADGYRDVQAKMQAQADIQQRVNLQLKTLKNLWDAATGTFTNALVAFGESIAPELHATAEWLGQVAESTQRWARENPGLAGGIMTTVKWLGLLLLVLGGLTTGIAAILAPIGMIGYGLTALGISAAPLAGVLGTVLGYVLGIPAAFAAGYAAGTLLNEGISKWISSLVGYETTLGGFIFDVMEKFRSASWKDIGLWILQGIEAGLDFATGGLYSKVSNIASGLVTAVKEKLGIHSPSRVFAELGAFTMQGMEQGLAGGEDGPLGAVASMAKKLAGIGAGVAIGGTAMAGDIPLDVRPPVAPAAMLGGLAPMHVEIHIHGSPGQPTGDIQRQVEKALENIEAKRRARTRSRLTDSE